MKVIHCAIWGDIEVDDLAQSLLDTWTFQRLHYIRQTGFGYKVFPTAQVSRFSHSLGCYHITRRFLQEIGRRQPEEIQKIPPRVLQLIPIAGLCHDIGHASYSHWFDRFVECLEQETKESKDSKELKDSKDSKEKNWKHHEERGMDILRYTIREIKEKREKSDKTDIESLEILPSSKLELWQEGDEEILERLLLGPYVHWYEHLVTNPKSSLDTDKLDYIIRDVQQFGLEKNMGSLDTTRLFANCKVIQDEIWYCDRIRDDIEHIFYLRSRLYSNIYHHPTIRRFEDEMMKKILDNTSLCSYIMDILQTKNIPQFLPLTDEVMTNLIFPTSSERISFECREWSVPKPRWFEGQDNHFHQSVIAKKNIQYYSRKDFL